MSAVTIVSYYFKPLREIRPTVVPSEFVIPAKGKIDPGILVIHDAKTLMKREGYPDFPVPIPAETLAKDLIDSYVSSHLDFTPDTRPAIFFVPGEYTAAEIVKKFQPEISEALKKQNAWCLKLVKRADDDWAKFHQHRMITDIQRWAANELHMLQKEWLSMPHPVETIKCPACGSFVESDVAKCKSCGFITNRAKAAEIGILELEPVKKTA